MPTDFETARSRLLVALRLRAAIDADYLFRANVARTALMRKGVNISEETLNVISFLASDLAQALQEGVDDAVESLSRCTVYSLWGYLTIQMQQALEAASGGKPRDFLAKLMVDYSVQYSA